MSQYHYDRLYDEEAEAEAEADSEYLFLIQKRVQCAIQRYAGIEEFMEKPNIDIWFKLKSEIMHHYYSRNYVEEEEYDYDYDDHERRCNSFIDRELGRRHSRRRRF